MNAPRILVLTTSYPSHSGDPSSVFIASLLKAIRKLGYSLKVVAPSDGTFFGERTVDGIDTLRFGYFIPRSAIRLTRGAGGIPENLNTSALARFQLAPMMAAFVGATVMEARRSDLIYANWVGAGIVGAIAGMLTGKPMVVSFRGDERFLVQERVLWRELTKWVSKRADVVAPVSRELVDILVDLGIPEDKFVVPRFGVDTEMFRPALAERSPGVEVRALYVGSLIPKKGVQDLLEALGDKSLEKVELTVVGDGFYGAELQSLSERLGLSARIKWAGMVSQPEVAEIMRKTDLLCLPSHTEGKPNVVREAMASGLPVIAARVGGVPEMVVEGRTALLHEPGDVEGLRERLITMSSDAELRTRMGRAGRDALLEADLSWDTTAEDFDKIFKGLLANTPNSKL